jgi:hypothetical protein
VLGCLGAWMRRCVGESLRNCTNELVSDWMSKCGSARTRVGERVCTQLRAQRAAQEPIKEGGEGPGY